jgi:tripartite-type tricarboxylate transporter receptor subunit TctC
LQRRRDYPVKPIRLLIPFPPAAPFRARQARTLKWQVIPENRPGASGNLAIAEAAKSAPDGYTIVMGQSDNMMLGPYLYANVGYDTVKSFVPIVQVSEAALAIVSNAQTPTTPVKLGNVADLVAKG